MASSKEYLDFILEQLSGLRGITHRAMMGEYILYYNGKIVGGIYDDRLLVKPVSAARALLPDAVAEAPYKGAKDMLPVDNVDSTEFLAVLFEPCMMSFRSQSKRNEKARSRNRFFRGRAFC